MTSNQIRRLYAAGKMDFKHAAHWLALLGFSSMLVIDQFLNPPF